MPLLVHAVIAADGSRSSAARHDAEIELVTHGEVAAVVRPVPDREVLPSRANLLEHTRLLESLTEEGAVLPMRFGVLVDDVEALVEDYLAPQQRMLVEALDRLRGHVELRLRGRYDEAEVVREVVADDPTAARLRGRRDMGSQMRLGERIVEGIEARRARDLDRVVQALEPHTAGIVANSVAEPLDAFSLSLLIPEDGRAAFDRALDQVGVDLGPVLALVLVGPLPAFSFATPEGAPA